MFSTGTLPVEYEGTMPDRKPGNRVTTWVNRNMWENEGILQFGEESGYR